MLLNVGDCCSVLKVGKSWWSSLKVIINFQMLLNVVVGY